MANPTPIDFSYTNITEPILRFGKTYNNNNGIAKIPRRYDSDEDSDDAPKRRPVPVPMQMPQFPVQLQLPMPQMDTNASKDIEGSDIEVFWHVISQNRWVNRSDGTPPVNEIKRRISNLSDNNSRSFIKEYEDILTTTRLVFADLYLKHNVRDEESQKKIASHVIALGQDQYQTFMDSLDLVEFFIMAGECISFDAVVRSAI